jgi:hypothetical protein
MAGMTTRPQPSVRVGAALLPLAVIAGPLLGTPKPKSGPATSCTAF